MVTVILLPPVLLATGITDSESRVNEAGQELAGDLAPLMWTVLILTAIFFVFRFVMGWIKTALSEDKSVAEIRAQLAKDRASGLVLKPKALESSQGQAPPVAVRTPPDLPPSRTPVRDNRASYRLLSVAGGAEHQIARAASYLDRWMWQRRNHFPRTGRLPLVDAPTSRLVSLPVVTGVTTDLVRTWSKAERKRLFRVVHADAWENGHGFLEVPVDVLAVNWSADKKRLDTDALVEEVLAVAAGGRWRSRLSPRMIWFRLTQDTARLKRTMASYIDDLQLEEDGKAALPRGNKPVWEEQSIPLTEGHRTPLGRGCFFIVRTMRPYGACEPLWLFSVERDEAPVLKDQRLRAPNFIEIDGTLLATIVSVKQSSVTLKVLAPGSAAVSLQTFPAPGAQKSRRALFHWRS